MFCLRICQHVVAVVVSDWHYIDHSADQSNSASPSTSYMPGSAPCSYNLRHLQQAFATCNSLGRDWALVARQQLPIANGASKMPSLFIYRVVGLS